MNQSFLKRNLSYLSITVAGPKFKGGGEEAIFARIYSGEEKIQRPYTVKNKSANSW